MVSPSVTAVTVPAAVIAAAEDLVHMLDEHLWAAVGDAQLVDGVCAIEAIKARLAAIEVGMVAEIDARDIARKKLHWASTSDWFTHLAGVYRRDGSRFVAHAKQLVGERRATLEALREGRTSPTQAGIICDAVCQLPGDTALRTEGERALIKESRHLNATDLTRAGRHLIEVVDPDRHERNLEADLAREERAAHLERFLSITDDGAGGIRLKGRGSLEDGAVLKAALLPLTKPAPAMDADDPTCASSRDPREHGARLWDAMVELAQHSINSERQPTSHGARPRVSILIDWQSLTTGLGDAGVTDDGLRLSPTTVRRLACDADLIPVCLGTQTEVLDVGRTARLVTPALWRALVARDRHCTFPACTRPPVMCHGHHIVHWADGGTTNLGNLALLCGEHHRIIHETPWQIRLASDDGRPEFLPPIRTPTRHRDPHDGLDPSPTWTRHRIRRQP